MKWNNLKPYTLLFICGVYDCCLVKKKTGETASYRYSYSSKPTSCFIPICGFVAANMFLLLLEILATSTYVVALACNKVTPTLCSVYKINAIHNNNPSCLHTIYWTDDFMRAQCLCYRIEWKVNEIHQIDPWQISGFFLRKLEFMSFYSNLIYFSGIVLFNFKTLMRHDSIKLYFDSNHAAHRHYSLLILWVKTVFLSVTTRVHIDPSS